MNKRDKVSVFVCGSDFNYDIPFVESNDFYFSEERYS